jgi:hypothetical protein
MRYTFRHAVAAVVGVGMLLACGRVGLADDGDAVKVKFAVGETELASIENGVSLTGNSGDAITAFPDQIAGMSFTRQSRGKCRTATVDVPAGATVLFMYGDGRDERAYRPVAEAMGATRIGTVRTECRNGLAVYSKTFEEKKHFTISGVGTYGVIIGSKNLELNTDDNNGNGGQTPAQPADTSPVTTLHIDPVPDDTALPGPAIRPAHSQASINALEIYEGGNGLGVD